MDRYFTGPRQKTEFDFTSLGPAVCIIGRSGTGKTWTAHKALGPKHVELTPEILRSKNDTIEFLQKVQGTDVPVLLDAYETVCDLVGLRELHEVPSNGLFLITSQIVPKFEFEIHIHEFPVKTFEEIKALCPEAQDDVIRSSKGDLRRVFDSLQFRSDAMDDFTAPKDIVASFVSTKTNVNPAKYLGWSVSEPGNCSSILNANYVDGPRRLDLAEIALDFSTADIFEDRIYGGSWDLIPYFNIHGLILPALKIGHTLKEPLKPGSTWTKFQNMCMRTKKIQAMSHRVPGAALDVQSLLLIRDWAEAGNYEILTEYGIQSQDVDVLNHLSPLRKLKPKSVSDIKKWLNAHASQSRR